MIDAYVMYMRGGGLYGTELRYLMWMRWHSGKLD